MTTQTITNDDSIVRSFITNTVKPGHESRPLQDVSFDLGGPSQADMASKRLTGTLNTLMKSNGSAGLEASVIDNKVWSSNSVIEPDTDDK